jgi:hypothetical protein
MVWFGWLSAISQLASRVGEGGGVGQICLHSVTQLTLPGPGGESREGGCVPSPWTYLARTEMEKIEEVDDEAAHVPGELAQQAQEQLWQQLLTAYTAQFYPPSAVPHNPDALCPMLYCHCPCPRPCIN